MATTSRDGIGARTVRGMFWAYGSYVGGRMLSLLATVILARLLLPADFGLVALALTAMAFLDMLQGLGVGEALVIAHPRDVEDKAETVFVVNVVVGLVLAVATAALGPAAASFFHQPMLVALMPVLGLNFLIVGLGATHSSLAQKRLDFRSRTVAELADVIARGTISVLLALAGAGVWSLVIGYAVGTAVWTITIWLRVPWRPHLRPQRRHLRGLLGFGGALTGVAVMGAFLNQFDNLVVGRVLGAAQLGYYSMATRLPYLFIVSLAIVAGRVLYPAFATLDEADMGRGFLKGLRYTVMVALPLTVFMAILAKPLTVGLFGEQWLPAVTAAQVLCLWALMSPVSMVCGNAFKSQGRADLLLKLAVPQAVALVVGSLVFVKQGIVVISWVQAVIAIVAQLVTIAIARRMFSLTVSSVLQALLPPVVASAGLGVVALLVQQTIHAPWTAIVVAGSAGTLAYAGLLAWLAPETLRGLRRRIEAPPVPGAIELGGMPSAADVLDETRPKST